MTAQVVILIVVGFVMVVPTCVLLAYDLWKRLWLISVGEVVSVRFDPAPRAIEAPRKVRIRYRFVHDYREYEGDEEKTLDVPYHQELDAEAELKRQFEKGSKIAVYHPRSIPAISSLTPSGAYVQQMLLALAIEVLILVFVYLYSGVASGALGVLAGKAHY